MDAQRSGRRLLVLFAATALALGTLLAGAALAETPGGGGSGGDGTDLGGSGTIPVETVPTGDGEGTPTESAPSTTDPTATVVSTSPSDGGDSGGSSSGSGSGDVETGTAVPGVDLAVTKSGSPDPVTAGSSLTYTVTVVNNGDTDAPDVMVFDHPPDEAPVLSASASQGSCSLGGGGPSCSLGTIVGGGSATATFNAFVLPDTPPGTITNSAVATTTATDLNGSNNEDTATTTVVTSSDVGLTKSRFPAPVPTGTNLTYSLTVGDLGPSDAQNVTLTDALPAGTTFVSLSAPAGWSTTTPAVGGTGTVTATTPTLGAADAAFFTLVVNVNAPSGNLIDNTATVTTTTTDPDPANNTAFAQASVAGSADLSVTKTDGPDPVTAGNDLTYTITATNAGGDFANNLTLADTLPAGTTFVSLTSPAGWSCTTPAMGAGGAVSCVNPSVAPATSGMFSLVVKVDAGVAGGSTISNTASVSASTFDPNTSNNSATATTAVTAVADVGVSKTDSPDPVTAGTDLTYTVTVTNTGPSDAQSVSLTDVVPTNTTFVSLTSPAGWNATTPAMGGTGTVTATTPSLAAGASAVFTLVVKVDANTASGATITNTASGTTMTTDPNDANNSFTATTAVTASADLAVTKSDSTDPVTAGTDLTYTIGVTNNGPSHTGGDVTVTDPLPAGTTFVSATPSQGSCSGTTTVTCDLGPMDNGLSATITVTVHVEASVAGGSALTNTASVSSTTSDPNTANNSATEGTDVVTSADVGLAKRAAPDPVTAGTDLTYTITATNHGPSDARDVTVTDPLPPGTTFVSVTPSQGSCSATTTVTCDLGTLADGASATITLVVHVDPAVPGGTVITNTATASSPEPEVSATTADPVERNNSASARVRVLAAPKAPEPAAGAPVGPATPRGAAAFAVVAVPTFTG